MEMNKNDLELLNVDELIAKPEYQEALNKIREERKKSFKGYYGRKNEQETKININRQYGGDDDVDNNENKKETKKEKKKKKLKNIDGDKPKKKNKKKKSE